MEDSEKVQREKDADQNHRDRMFHLAAAKSSFLKFISVVLVYTGFLAVFTTRRVFDSLNLIFLLTTTAASVFLAAVYGYNFYRHVRRKQNSDRKYREVVEGNREKE